MTKDYGMFTEFGNDAIESIVTSARVLKMDWPTVQNELWELRNKFPNDFGEAFDTVVRENVYEELGFKTPFYC